MSYYKSLLEAHVAVFFMGITGVIAAVSGIAPWHVTSYRVTLGALVLLLLPRFYVSLKGLPGKRIALYLAMGFLLSIHWYTFFLSLEMLGVMLGYAMTGTQPLLIALLGRVILKEQIPGKTVLALVIALLGFLLLGFEGGEGPQLWSGVLVALFSFVLFSLLILFNRQQVQHTSPLALTTLEMLGAIPLTLLMTLPNWSPGTPQGWFWALILGVLCTGMAYVLYNRSMKVLAAPVAGLLLSLEVVYGLIGGVLIGDTLTWTQAIAALLIANILFFDLHHYVAYRFRNRG